MLDQKMKKIILKDSISLKKFGLNDFAWKKQDAINLIDKINFKDIGIFGGDVYQLTTRLESLSDNWSCDQKINEPLEEFYERSKKESLIYIQRYPVHSNECILFAITFTEQISDF